MAPGPIYDLNTPIEVFYSNSSDPSGDVLVVGAGLLALPLADGIGDCNENNFVRFENNQVESCNLRIEPSVESFSTQCSTLLSVAQYSSSLLIAK